MDIEWFGGYEDDDKVVDPFIDDIDEEDDDEDIDDIIPKERKERMFIDDILPPIQIFAQKLYKISNADNGLLYAITDNMDRADEIVETADTYDIPITITTIEPISTSYTNFDIIENDIGFQYNISEVFYTKKPELYGIYVFTDRMNFINNDNTYEDKKISIKYNKSYHYVCNNLIDSINTHVSAINKDNSTKASFIPPCFNLSNEEITCLLATGFSSVRILIQRR